MKLLLIGKDGQLGFELQRALAPLGAIVAVGREGCDLSDPDAVRKQVRACQPDVIVNAAAYTAVDLAETNSDTAFAINATAVGVIGEEAERIGASVVHYSTDYVFSGSKESPYSEEDQPDPKNTYGRSKLAGEQALLNTCSRSLVVRTSWVVGAHGGNFLKTMLRLASERDALNVVADQIGAPTSAGLLADISAHLIRQLQVGQKDAFPYGIYNLTASGATNWHEYASYIVGEAISAGLPLKATPDRVRAITSAEYPTPASRPQNSLLDTRKLRETFGLVLPDWRVGVKHVLQQII